MCFAVRWSPAGSSVPELSAPQDLRLVAATRRWHCQVKIGGRDWEALIQKRHRSTRGSDKKGDRGHVDQKVVLACSAGRRIDRQAGAAGGGCIAASFAYMNIAEQLRQYNHMAYARVNNQRHGNDACAAGFDLHVNGPMLTIPCLLQRNYEAAAVGP